MNSIKLTNFHSIINCIFILIISILLGTILLVGVYSLPISLMKENVARSSSIFDYEGVYPQLVQGYKSSQLDNCTDAIMLGTAIEPGNGDSVVRRAMINQRIEFKGETPVQSLNDYANDVGGKEESKFYAEYGRYWHGYLVILKPLLLLFDYGDLRYINIIFQSILIGWLVALLIEQKLKRVAVAFGISLLILNPIAVMLSLQFSSVYYLMLFACIIIIKQKAHIIYSSKYFIYFFFLLGILTSFFDFLTYPAITLGIPLILFLAVNENITIYVKLKGIFKAVIFWGLGYGGMWSGKWLIASLLLKSNMFADAFSNILFRTSMEKDGDKLNWGLVIWRNVRVLLKWPFIILGIIILLFVLLCLIKSGLNGKSKEVMKRIIPYFIISLIPFAWYFFMGNHSYEHYWFTFRELGITCFSALICLFYVPQKLKL